YTVSTVDKKPRKIGIKYVYHDQYGRIGPIREAAANVIYSMPLLLLFPYYGAILLVFTILGQAIIGVISLFNRANHGLSRKIVPKLQVLKSVVSGVLLSWGLAIIVCLLAVILQVKVAPLGIEISSSNIPGIATIGLVAGLMPDQ